MISHHLCTSVMTIFIELVVPSIIDSFPGKVSAVLT